MNSLDSIVRQVMLGDLFSKGDYSVFLQLAIRGFRDLQKSGGFRVTKELDFDSSLYIAPAPDDMINWTKIATCNSNGFLCPLSYNADICQVRVKQDALCQCDSSTAAQDSEKCSDCGGYYGYWDFWNYQPKKGILGQLFSRGSMQRYSSQGMFRFNKQQHRFEFSKNITDTLILEYVSSGLSGIDARSQVIPEHMVEVMIAWIQYHYMMSKDVAERKVIRFRLNYLSKKKQYMKSSFKYSFDDLKRSIRSTDYMSIKG